jgi:hypothetical protein
MRQAQQANQYFSYRVPCEVVINTNPFIGKRSFCKIKEKKLYSGTAILLAKVCSSMGCFPPLPELKKWFVKNLEAHIFSLLILGIIIITIFTFYIIHVE